VIDEVEDFGGVAVLVLDPDGPKIATERDGTDMIGDAMGADAQWIAVPVGRLSDDFLKLSTGLAGAILQKTVNYRLNVAVVGDVSAQMAVSKPLNDFVGESNRGRHVWFVRDLTELRGRLGSGTV
jgi:hypothetical protein